MAGNESWSSLSEAVGVVYITMAYISGLRSKLTAQEVYDIFKIFGKIKEIKLCTTDERDQQTTSVLLTYLSGSSVETLCS